MTEREPHVVGIVQTREVFVIIQALEKVEQEVEAQRTVLEQANAFGDEWFSVAERATSVGNALGMLRLVFSSRQPYLTDATAWTIGGPMPLKQALAAMGRPSQPDVREMEPRSEWEA